MNRSTLKNASIIVGVITILGYIGAIAEWISENPHITLFHAIAFFALMMIVFLLGFLFIMFFVYMFTEC